MGRGSKYESWYKKPSDISYFRVFGTIAYSFIQKEKRKKFDKKSKNGIFVGYSENKKGYRIYFKDTNAIEISRDVIFEDELDESKNDVKSRSKPKYVSLDLLDADVDDDDNIDANDDTVVNAHDDNSNDNDESDANDDTVVNAHDDNSNDVDNDAVVSSDDDVNADLVENIHSQSMSNGDVISNRVVNNNDNNTDSNWDDVLNEDSETDD